MRALVIGAAGFVGGYLCRALESEGYEVFATKLVNEEFSAKANVSNLDLTDFSVVNAYLKEVKPQVIFHLAAQSSVKLSWEKPQFTANVNITGAINLFEAVKNNCKEAKIVVIGSSEEYGDIDYTDSVKEDTATEPSNIYALTKYAQEKLALIYVKAYGLHIVMTRSFNHIGAGQPPQFVVADFCRQIALIEKGEQKPEISVGNLQAYRDFSDVRDVVQAYIILSKYGADGQVYNVGSGQAVKIEDILQLIISKSTKKVEIKVDKNKFRPVDVKKIQADITKIQSLGWQPKIAIEQSVTDTLNYFRGK